MVGEGEGGGAGSRRTERCCLRRCGLAGAARAALHGADDAGRLGSRPAAPPSRRRFFAGARGKQGSCSLAAEPDVRRRLSPRWPSRLRAEGLAAAHPGGREGRGRDGMLSRLAHRRRAPGAGDAVLARMAASRSRNKGGCTSSCGSARARFYPSPLMQFLLDAGGTDGAASARWHASPAELYRLFLAEDAQLIEINPVGVTARARSTRSTSRPCSTTTPAFVIRIGAEWLSAQPGAIKHHAARERAPRTGGLTLVELDGCVALFAGGAGFGMALVDLLGRRRHSGRQFADASGGTQPRGLCRHGRRHHGAGSPRPT